MKIKIAALVASLAGMAVVGAAHAATTVSVNVYNTYTDTGSSITFAGSPAVSTTLPATPNGFSYDWNSNGVPGYNANTSFAADLKGGLYAQTAGNYTLNFTSDDAGYLFVNNALAGSEPGTHPSYTISPTVYLNAGLNNFEIQYDNTECCGANVALSLPSGVSEVSGVPEPASWALMILGVAGIGSAMRFQRRHASVVAAI